MLIQADSCLQTRHLVVPCLARLIIFVQAHGMRCLGIPNTIHFTNITKIKDALELWERLKTKKVDRMFSAENEEEFEDSNGNVFNKKTYEDLKRQDLL